MLRYIWFVGLLMIAVFQIAQATQTGYPSDAEITSLPQYCYVKLKKPHNDQEFENMYKKMGEIFQHIHHYCQGLNNINRYHKASNSYDRAYYLGVAAGEIGYVITHTLSNSSLLPEVYMNRGFAYAKLHKDGDALKDFIKSLELNPRSAQTYSMIANFYEERKMQNKALEYITEGLKYIPNNKTLQRRYLKLGGKEPFPEPYEQVKTNLPPAEKIKEITPIPSEEKANPTENVEPKLDKSEPPTIDNLPTKIGAPGNPFCRFCPDTAPVTAPVITAPPQTAEPK
ncbi:MAG: tetratricopeptide repeat protein [Methylophilaceae bacterium]|nr:tetratricopeptide repeat protein [Methylophilaceae bacterium]